jgi:hypothetical protein
MYENDYIPDKRSMNLSCLSDLGRASFHIQCFLRYQCSFFKGVSMGNVPLCTSPSQNRLKLSGFVEQRRAIIFLSGRVFLPFLPRSAESKYGGKTRKKVCMRNMSFFLSETFFFVIRREKHIESYIF